MIFQETFSQKFSRICSFIDIYRAESLTLGITLILFTQAIAQLKDIYRGLIAPISINHGLLQDVFTDTLWSTRILCQPENFQETLLISGRFPGVLDTLNCLSLKNLVIKMVWLYVHNHHRQIERRRHDNMMAYLFQSRTSENGSMKESATTTGMLPACKQSLSVICPRRLPRTTRQNVASYISL